MSLLDEFRCEDYAMDHLNQSYLFLLSKKQGASTMGDYHLISLSNSIYLIITKVLADHPWEVIGPLIEPFEHVVIPSRQLVDSVVLAGEIVTSW